MNTKFEKYDECPWCTLSQANRPGQIYIGQFTGWVPCQECE